jgi:hypothetical protein
MAKRHKALGLSQPKATVAAAAAGSPPLGQRSLFKDTEVSMAHPRPTHSRHLLTTARTLPTWYRPANERHAAARVDDVTKQRRRKRRTRLQSLRKDTVNVNTNELHSNMRLNALLLREIKHPACESMLRVWMIHTDAAVVPGPLLRALQRTAQAYTRTTQAPSWRARGQPPHLCISHSCPGSGLCPAQSPDFAPHCSYIR